MTQHADKLTTTEEGVSRRTLVKGAAWSVPVIAVAIAAPSAAASTVTVNGFSVDGTCGVLGLLGVGFNLTAGTVAIPAGSTLTITSTGAANVGLLPWSGSSLLGVAVLSDTSVQVTVNTAIAAGASAAISTLLSVSLISTITGTLSLPTGYVAGTGTKPTGQVNTLLAAICNGS